MFFFFGKFLADKTSTYEDSFGYCSGDINSS